MAISHVPARASRLVAQVFIILLAPCCVSCTAAISIVAEETGTEALLPALAACFMFVLLEVQVISIAARLPRSSATTHRARVGLLCDTVPIPRLGPTRRRSSSP